MVRHRDLDWHLVYLVLNLAIVRYIDHWNVFFPGLQLHYSARQVVVHTTRRIPVDSDCRMLALVVVVVLQDEEVESVDQVLVENPGHSCREGH